MRSCLLDQKKDSYYHLHFKKEYLNWTALCWRQKHFVVLAYAFAFAISFTTMSSWLLLGWSDLLSKLKLVENYQFWSLWRQGLAACQSYPLTWCWLCCKKRCSWLLEEVYQRVVLVFRVDLASVAWPFTEELDLLYYMTS